MIGNHDLVVSIIEDNHDNLWFVSALNGIARYDGANWTEISTKEGLPSNYGFACFQDTGGTFWFGTSAGVTRYDGTSMQTLTINEGLAGKLCDTIIQDKKGNLWFGSENGVSRYNNR